MVSGGFQSSHPAINRFDRFSPSLRIRVYKRPLKGNPICSIDLFAMDGKKIWMQRMFMISLECRFPSICLPGRSHRSLKIDNLRFYNFYWVYVSLSTYGSMTEIPSQRRVSLETWPKLKFLSIFAYNPIKLKNLIAGSMFTDKNVTRHAMVKRWRWEQLASEERGISWLAFL